MKSRLLAALLVLVAIGLGVSWFLPKAFSSAKAGTSADRPLPVDYDRYDYRRREGDKVIHVGSIPTGVSSIFTIQSLLHDGVLQEQLAAKGWRLKTFGYRSGKDVLPYADGRLDVLTVGDTEALLAIHRYPMGVFAVVRQGTNTIIAKRRITPSELKGLKIGYTPGTTLHFTLERALEAVGLSPEDFVSVPMVPDEMEAALRSGKVDAVSTLEPFASIILTQVQGSSVIASSDSYTYLLANLDFAHRHPEVLDAILAAGVRAARWGRQSDDHLQMALLWIRQANLRFVGQSRVEPRAPWVGVLHRETIDNASFPMLPPDVREVSGLQHRQFEYLKKVGFLPQEAEWRQARERFRLDKLSEVIRHGQAWRIDEFRYLPERLDLPEAKRP